MRDARTRRMAEFYAGLALLMVCSAGFGAALLHTLQPEVMIARAIEREIGR